MFQRGDRHDSNIGPDLSHASGRKYKMPPEARFLRFLRRNLLLKSVYYSQSTQSNISFIHLDTLLISSATAGGRQGGLISLAPLSTRWR